MKIGIDGRAAKWYRGTGIGTYTHQLISSLNNSDKDNDYLIFLPDGSSLKNLNDREKEIVQLRFGLNGKREKTQKEVADLLGISQSYISRLEKKIINRLKKEISRMI